MLSYNKFSKGGILGALTGLLISVFTHKSTDPIGKKAVKSGALGAAGYFLGEMAERKIRERKK